MDLRRLRTGEWLLAVAGLLAFVSVFLPWYEVLDQSASGWEALTVVDVLLATCGLTAIGVVVLTAAMPSPSPGIAAQALLTLLAFTTLVAVAARVISLPSEFEAREIGQWLGLASALGMVAGCMLAMRDERLSDPAHPTDSTGVPVSAPPEIETLPAPPR